ncbi:tol-pal system protein YbgF [Limimaricola sp.]|uniref:tol-pal system protein YbgF n=1 Tax=Limimaricola sp. TaxID=2211665 RepID=UPI0025BBD86A|nr:tol-pal system protein YbgF [Limimaricola sp.]
MTRFGICLIAAVLTVAGAMPLRADSLVDIRQEIAALNDQVQSLRGELTASGGLTTGVAGNTPLERLNSIEDALQKLTAKTEELEFRINQIVTDGTNRLGDLEFRVCELETGCDVSKLGDTAPLGGTASTVPAPAPAPQTGTTASGTSTGPELAVGEKQDFDLAQQDYDAGNYQGTVDKLANYATDYPGGPLVPQAHMLRGQALAQLGKMTDAARSYLDAFSAAPTGDVAPEALYRLGDALGKIGQVQDACVTLAEVGRRFPGNPAVAEAATAMQGYGCQ